jgi:hypothetical protein
LRPTQRITALPASVGLQLTHRGEVGGARRADDVRVAGAVHGDVEPVVVAAAAEIAREAQQWIDDERARRVVRFDLEADLRRLRALGRDGRHENVTTADGPAPALDFLIHGRLVQGRTPPPAVGTTRSPAASTSTRASALTASRMTPGCAPGATTRSNSGRPELP